MMTTYFISFLLFLVCFAGGAQFTGADLENLRQHADVKQCSISDCPPKDPTFCTADVVPVYCFPDPYDLTKYDTYGNCCEACNDGKQSNCFEVVDSPYLP